ncbi:MAG: hypothetical protein UDA86_05085 [Blautia sp.]|nr:hypothetical protein [Blautia sp.]
MMKNKKGATKKTFKFFRASLTVVLYRPHRFPVHRRICANIPQNLCSYSA